MALDRLPATVYQPCAGPAPARRLNTIIEEEPCSQPYGRLDAQQTHLDPLLTIPPAALKASPPPAPRGSPSSSVVTVISPSSSIDSTVLTWISSETSSTIDTNTDIEDLCSPAETDDGRDIIQVMLVDQPSSKTRLPRQSRIQDASTPDKPKCPRLSIPPTKVVRDHWSAKRSSPIPPTPPPKVPLSPAVLVLLAPPAPPLPSGPPSLDGSLTSDQLSSAELPSTPSIGPSLMESTADWDQGVHLGDAALATLHMLSNESIPELSEAWIEPERPSSSDSLPIDLPPPPSAINPAVVLTRLEIPSPRGFFSSLGSGARLTWCPPSTTTAEGFYNCPWNPPLHRVREQILELDDVEIDQPLTAELVTPRQPGRSLTSPRDGAVIEASSVDGLDCAQPALILPSTAASRTARWLSTQQAYIQPAALHAEQMEGSVLPDGSDVALPASDQASTTPAPLARSVALGTADELPDDTMLWRVFRRLRETGDDLDAFVHRQTRFDAVQSRRVLAPAAHAEELRGRFPLPTLRPPPDAVDDESTMAQVQGVRDEAERRAAIRIRTTHWTIMAEKYLDGGQHFISPARQLLTVGTIDDPVQVLDLGGDPVCGWAWACADEFPHAFIVTVVPASLGHPSPAVHQGPINHSTQTVPRLWELPFPNDHFDVVSTRSVHMLLKVERPSGRTCDEYDLVLRECLRCLKPGGYLEFTLLDSVLQGAGPLGSALSVEFGFKLRTRGYDPLPTRVWLNKLDRAGFDEVHHFYQLLPMGVAGNGHPSLPNGHPTIGARAEAGVDLAEVTGMVGLRAWERWMSVLQTEVNQGQVLPVNGVDAVLREGRDYAAGWKGLKGWAQKPVVAS